MTLFKKLAIAATLAFLNMAGAHAASMEEDTTFLLQNSNADLPGVFTGHYPISNLGLDINLMPVQTRIVGDTFVDEFILQVLDSQDLSISFVALTTTVNNVVIPNVTFSGATLYDFLGDIYPFSASMFTSTSFSASGLTLDSGLYALQVTGMINVADGAYGGSLETVPSVPEPATWALMVVGFGLVSAISRRRAIRGH